MSRDPYIEQRLINWAKWCARGSSGGLGFASTNWDAWDGTDRYGAGRAPIIQDDEQAITDQAVRALDRELQEALVLQYVDGGNAEAKASKAGVHVQTFRARVARAERGVSAWLTERERAAAAERERVEAMQRATTASLTAREAVVIADRRRTDAVLGLKAPRRIRRSK